MSKRRNRTYSKDWRNTPEGQAKYEVARADAQAKANALGMDQGLEANDFFQMFTSFTLPERECRQGHETRCEVVWPENLDKCRPGHGPCAPRPLSMWERLEKQGVR